jgi:cell division protein FtsQ
MESKMMFGLFARKSQGKKKKRNQKKEVSEEAKNLIRKVIFNLSIYLFVIIISILGIWQLSNYIAHWDYFDIKHIQIPGEKLSTKEAARYCDIDLPQNIINLDLRLLANHILQIHPDLKQAQVERKLPNTLVINIERRNPVAQVAVHNEYYLVDKEAFIICKINYQKKDLAVIDGLRSSEINDIEKGTCLSEKLKIALRLLDSYRSIISENTYKVLSIDVSNSRNYVIFISDGLEIRLGRDSFDSKLRNLSLILKDNNVPSDSYIDLRFKDVTVGPRKS